MCIRAIHQLSKDASPSTFRWKFLVSSLQPRNVYLKLLDLYVIDKLDKFLNDETKFVFNHNQDFTRWIGCS